MFKKPFHKYNKAILAVLLLLLGILISVFSGLVRDDVKNYLEYYELDSKTIWITLFSLIGFAIIFTFLNVIRKDDEETSQTQSKEDIEPDVQRFYNSLKERYQKRYESKLDGRFEITLEVSDDFDSKPTSISEQFGENPTKGEAIKVISKAFTEKGRLLIAGNAGVGKTVLLLKLAVNLLDNIKDEEKEPFPVIFNLASWSDEFENFGDWLNSMLVSGYGLSKDFAETHLQENRIILFLDGLDELARNEEDEEASEVRAKCLTSLNEYLIDGRKAVICSRIDEFLLMKKQEKQDAPVSAKVRVLNLTKEKVVKALENARDGEETKHHASAIQLLELVENKHLIEVLKTPFYFTTALEVFDKQILEQKRYAENENEIKEYLIENFVDKKLKKTPNPSNFEKENTLKWLGWLASLMEKKQIVVFELADLQSNNLNKSYYYPLIYSFLVNFIFIVTYVSVVTVFAAFSYELQFRVYFVIKMILLISFIVFPLAFIYTFLFPKINTIDRGHHTSTPLFNLRTYTNSLLNSSIYSTYLIIIIIVLRIGAEFIKVADFLELVPIDYYYLTLKNYTIFYLYLIFNFFVLAIISSCRIKIKYSHVKKAYYRLTSGFTFNILKGLVFSISLIGIMIIQEWRRGIIFELSNLGLVFTVLIYGVLLGIFSTPVYKHFSLRLCFFLDGSIPLKYATFLDYCAEARILEKDGGHWRFRHQNLQDYFAKLDEV